jgi:hypothetical protein
MPKVGSSFVAPPFEHLLGAYTTMSQHRQSTRTETETDDSQRAIQQAIRYPIEQTVQFQKGAGKLFLNSLELTDWAQSRGVQMTRQLFDNYISTLEDTARETEAIADQGIQTVQEAGARQGQSAQTAMQASQQAIGGNAPGQMGPSQQSTQAGSEPAPGRQPQRGREPRQQGVSAPQPMGQTQPPTQSQPPMQSQPPTQSQPPMQSQPPETGQPRSGFQTSQRTDTSPTGLETTPAASQEPTERAQGTAAEQAESQEPTEIPQPNQ